ncbi:unnamed protein product [Protopolystoma xenopodis]|uniref:Uncharacterized protein n=1 Tax=Protopolystoma xenopodis TaxID=117903 RepID=A0A3S5FG75_9PLAT|nr:unnamed protein product [Protopolystoma xenopodis]
MLHRLSPLSSYLAEVHPQTSQIPIASNVCMHAMNDSSEDEPQLQVEILQNWIELELQIVTNVAFGEASSTNQLGTNSFLERNGLFDWVTNRN